MKREYTNRIQDSIHGLMEYYDNEALVIDLLSTQEIQRLRRIRQLGLASLVFPGAEHSRFGHCLGASYLAILFMRKLRNECIGYLPPALVPSNSNIRDMGIAALCHDLGHGPLSHAWEKREVQEKFKLENWINKYNLTDDKDILEKMKWHELVTYLLLTHNDSSIKQALDSYEVGFSNRIRNILLGSYGLNYLSRLLSSDIDVDRGDYIMRDSVYCGVFYGRYDINWLISTFTIGETDDGNFVIGFDNNKSPWVIQQFLVGRRALYNTVYFHKTVQICECMVAKLLVRLSKVLKPCSYNKYPPLIHGMIKTLTGDVPNISELLSMDDYSLWVLIQQVALIEEDSIGGCCPKGALKRKTALG